jgi:thiol:disulfide interchange protein DsbA
VNRPLVLCIVLLLAACQPSINEDQSSGVNETASLPSENKTSPNEFSLLVDLPYDIIETDQACEEPIVIEFFAYQCPHCYTLEKQAALWKEKNQGKVKFLAVPTHLGHQEFSSFLIVHQAAKRLGIIEKAMPKMFTRLHEEKKAFASQDDVISFFQSLGVSEENARTAIQSGEEIQKEIDKGFEMLAKYKIASVPTIIVNYRYQFDVTKAGGYDKVFNIVDETLKLPSSCSTN